MMKSLTKLNQEVSRTLALARNSFPLKTFPEPKIKMDLTGKTAGMYDCKKNILRFNLNLMLENKEDFIYNTVPHEVAHFVTHVIDKHSKPHGVTWQAIMNLFGIPNPQVYHYYAVASVKKRKRPYVYQCSCRKYFFTKIRHRHAQDGIRYYCSICHGNLQYIECEP